MGRPSRYTAADLVRAVQELATQQSPAEVTISAVSRAAGAPVGSIYHRFPSQAALLGAAWLDALEAFQAGFIPALEDPGEPGLAACTHTLRFSRAEPARARVLVLHRARDFGSQEWPPEDRERSRRLATELDAALGAFASRHLGAPGGEAWRRATFAVLDVPYAAVHRYLAVGVEPPPQIDAYLTAALPVILAAGRPG